jgi:2-keto-4-pentenoate hydratase/2-oxohepta-3-ene-1,7-dioic acid hydratase in catechol pathway
MHLVTLQASPRSSAGVVLGDEVIDLAACAAMLPDARCIPSSVRGILEGGDTALELVRRVQGQVGSANTPFRERLQEQGGLKPLAGARLLAPVPDTRFVLSCGMNYRKHLHEMGGSVPEKPLSFSKNVHSIIGPDAPIVLPKLHPHMVDWEIEFSAVIGRPCHNVSRAEALEYVAGYTLINDVSARDWVGRFGAMQGMAAIEGWEQNLLGKHFPTFCPMGPTLVTKDGLPNADAVNLELRLNGQVMQSACTDDLVFSVATLISHYSQFYAFQPGDVVTTGSPAGVGFGRNPSVFLKAGDVVTLIADGVGVMNNPVVGPR